jgi:DNA-binding transcriptional regulator YdaS (Cro superfamily)
MASGMDLIRARRGLLAQVAHGLGMTRAAIVKWRQVPAERVVEVERITGIPREQLRPDLYRKSTPHTRELPEPLEAA